MSLTWRERIAAARQRGHFTDHDVANAKSWDCCAIAEQHRLHPDIVRRTVTAFPVDEALQTLGLTFCEAVDTADMHGAESLLDQIEDRVLQLKRAAG